MKVWEKCNEVKGTDETIEQIAGWAYYNRICPLMFDVGLEIDFPLDEDGYLDAIFDRFKELQGFCADGERGTE